jgi:PleD family two-component response regulator
MEDGKAIVLAIDDNIQQLSEFKSMLVPQYDLRVVKAASEAVSFLIKTNADVILLDIEMPNVNGFEFLNDVRKIPSYINVPIIIVSGNSGADFLSKARSTSAVDVLIKPVRQDSLTAAIEKALAGKK